MNKLFIASSRSVIYREQKNDPYRKICTVDDFFRRVSLLAFIDNDFTLGAHELYALSAQVVATINAAQLPSLKNYLSLLREIYENAYTPQLITAQLKKCGTNNDAELWQILQAIDEQLFQSKRIFSYQAQHLAWQHLQKCNQLPLSLPSILVFLDEALLSMLQKNILTELQRLGLSIDYQATPPKTLIDLFGQKKLHICAAADPKSEADFIASSVTQLKIAHGPGARVAISFAQYNQKVDDICDRLADYGVAVRKKSSLADAPCLQFLVMVIDAVIASWPLHQLLNILTHQSYLYVLADEKSLQIVWRTLLGANCTLDSLGETCTSGAYKRALESLQTQANFAEKAKICWQQLDPLLSFASTIKSSANLHEYLQMTLQFFSLYAPEMPNDGRSIWREIAQASIDCIGDLGAAGFISLADFNRWLKDATKRISWSAESSLHTDDAELLSIKNMQGEDFDIVVVCDMRHGILPAIRENKLLSRQKKAQLNQLCNAPLFLTDEAIAQAELHYMQKACLSARQELVLSTAILDDAGKEQAVSSYFRLALQSLKINPDGFSGQKSSLAPKISPHEYQFLLMQEHIKQENYALLSDDVRKSVQAHRERREFFAATENERKKTVFAFALGQNAKATFEHKLGLKADAPLTATKLESFAICRYRGFLEHIIGIRAPEKIGFDVSPRILGQVAHKVLQRYYQSQKKNSSEKIDDKLLSQLFWQEAANFSENWKNGNELAARARLGWLHSSLQKMVYFLGNHPPVACVEPQEFEFAIGTSSSTHHAIAIKMNDYTIYFGGIIDRVDESAQMRIVIDYKMSSKAVIQSKTREKEFLKTHFQIPLYLRLLEEIRPSKNKDLGGYLLSIKDAAAGNVIGFDKFTNIRELISDDSLEDGLAQSAFRVLQPLLESFAPADVNDACPSCSFAQVCRVRVHHAH